MCPPPARPSPCRCLPSFKFSLRVPARRSFFANRPRSSPPLLLNNLLSCHRAPGPRLTAGPYTTTTFWCRPLLCRAPSPPPLGIFHTLQNIQTRLFSTTTTRRAPRGHAPRGRDHHVRRPPASTPDSSEPLATNERRTFPWGTVFNYPPPHHTVTGSGGCMRETSVHYGHLPAKRNRTAGLQAPRVCSHDGRCLRNLY